ncbi:hypothetical protein ACFL01_04450 [Planctomycetota bacterium]
MKFTPNLMTTGIGSVPHTDADEAVSFVCGADFSIPFWPQLPKRHFFEQMIPQYSEGMPCVSLDVEEKSISFDPESRIEALSEFYEKFLAEDPALFPLPEDYARGFYAFERACNGADCPMAKGHVTGPITFATGISDKSKQTLFGDTDLRDATVKLLSRKAQWQIARLKQFASEAVVIFVDEPVLSAFGSSAYLGISEEDVRTVEGELFQAIADAGGISGIHVCGNSDWGVIIRTGVQIVNFDAYQYGTRMALYADDVRTLFDRGGCIAWGIVPTTDEIDNETIDSLSTRLQESLAAMQEAGFAEDLVKERSLLTPSCGVGSMDPDKASKVFDLLRELRERFR